MDKSQYKNVYVFVEQRDGVVQNVALELLGKARELADALHEQVIALLLGKGVKDKADELIAAGADVVLSIEADELAQYTTEPYAQAITQVIHERKPSILLIGATSIGRDLGPRLSARIGTGLTAAGRTDENDKLLISDLEAEIRNSNNIAGINFLNVTAANGSHNTYPPVIYSGLQPG